VALRAFYNQVIPGPVKIAMIGSGCSVATAPTAENSPYYNITHVSSSVHGNSISSEWQVLRQLHYLYSMFHSVLLSSG